MNTRKEQIEAIFGAAIELRSPEQRVVYLAKVCGDDHGLHREVEELIQAYDKAGGFLTASSDHAEAVSCSGASSATVVLPVTEKPGDRIGRYKLLQQIGEGGCGVVYMAEQEEPVRRRVALKVIKLGMETRSVVARFEAERQALALMEHPNIAQVFDAGATDTGRPFFVMELVRGIKITEYCDQNNLSTRERLDLFVQVCHAVQHAHQKGVIHRDLKPSNVLVTVNDGQPVPKVIDFGIAKATAQQRLTEKTLFTAFEQFIGTPAYMSPEQAAMTSLDIDTRSDIYSLGVLLYELLTGKTPFDAKTLLAAGLDEMRRIIREQEPVRPSTRLGTMVEGELTTTAEHRQSEPPALIHLLRGDLDWIVMKALEKDRTRRYETANGLVHDIQRHLNHEPVTARPPSTAYRLHKFVRRNRLMVTAGVVVATVLMLGVVVSTWQSFRADRERERAVINESKARKAQAELARQQVAEQEARRLAEQQAYAANINLAYQAWKEGNLGRLRRLLATCRPEPGGEDPRGWWEWRYLWGLARGDDLGEVARFAGGVWRIACAEHANAVGVGLLGMAAEEKGGFLYDLAADRLVSRRKFATNWLSGAVFLPRSGRLLSNRPDDHGRPGISVLEANSLQEVARLQTTNEVRLMRVSRDGRWLASLEKKPTPGSTLGLWRTEDWSRCWETQVDGDGLFDGGRVEFLKGDTRVAIGSAHGRVTVLETATGDSVREISVHSDGVSDEVTALAYVPASHLLAVGAGYRDSKITLWNPDTGERVRELTDHRAHIPDLAVSPDGRWLASASADQTIRLWETTTWDCAATLRGHEDEVNCLSFSADGKRLITGDKDGSVRVWPIPPLQRTPALRVVPEPCGILRLSPDSQRMVTFWPGGEYVVWDMNTGEKLPPLTALGGSQGLCWFSPDGQQLLVGGPTGRVQVWDFARNTFLTEFDTGRPEETHPLMSVPGTNLVLMEHLTGGTTDGDFWRRYFSAGPNRYYTLWQYDPRRLVTEFPRLGKTARTCNLSSRGDFALVPDDGSFSFQRITPTLAHTNFWPHRRGVTDVAFTPDGSILATAGDEGLVKLWDAATLREIVALKGHLLSSIWALDISADGRRLATAGPGKEAVKLWDIQTHHELITLTIQGWAIARIEFSRDGNKLVGHDTPQRHLHLWRAPSWQEIAAAEARERAGGHQP